MDELSDVRRVVRVFHIVTDGECIVECAGLPAARMESGDVIVFPHGDPHTMSGVETSAPRGTRAA